MRLTRFETQIVGRDALGVGLLLTDHRIIGGSRCEKAPGRAKPRLHGVVAPMGPLDRRIERRGRYAAFVAIVGLWLVSRRVRRICEKNVLQNSV